MEFKKNKIKKKTTLTLSQNHKTNQNPHLLELITVYIF